MIERSRIADIVVTLCNDCLLDNGVSSKLPNLTADEWNEVLLFSSKQGVLPVVTSLFADLTVNDARTRMVMVRGYASALKNQQRYRQRMTTMRALVEMMSEKGIDIMFMKGAALAQMYPEPEWRVFSDIDYYLFGKSEQGIEVMKKHGIINSAYYHHHTQASLHGILLENHYDFVERVNHRCDIILDDALKELAVKEGHTIKATFLGNDIHGAYLMTPTMNAIFLMRHMSAHFVSETVPLRMLYDWILFLRTHASDVDWNIVNDLYARSDMGRFAGIIKQILQSKIKVDCCGWAITPGLTADANKVWNSIINPPVRDPYRKFSLRYYIFEAKIFFANRWKHKIVYPRESYMVIFFKYIYLGLKKMIGGLRTDD